MEIKGADESWTCYFLDRWHSSRALRFWKTKRQKRHQRPHAHPSKLSKYFEMIVEHNQNCASSFERNLGHIQLAIHVSIEQFYIKQKCSKLNLDIFCLFTWASHKAVGLDICYLPFHLEKSCHQALGSSCALKRQAQHSHLKKHKKYPRQAPPKNTPRIIHTSFSNHNTMNLLSKKV